MLQQYLREMDAPFDSLTTLCVRLVSRTTLGAGADHISGDLARDANLDHSTGQRTHSLLPLAIDSNLFEHDLAFLSSLDPRQYDLVPIIDFGQVEAHQAETFRFAHAPRALEGIESTFAAGRQADRIERDRIKSDTQRLVLDLVLSRTIVHSEDIRPSGRTSTIGNATSSTETPEDLFERTQQLTLDESAGSAKLVGLRFLIPKAAVPGTFEDEGGLDPPPDMSDALQTPSARRLLAEWDLGTDPAAYSWTGWRETPSRPSTPISRPVRPLPSPRSTQRFPQSQPSFTRQLPGYAPVIAPTAVSTAARPIQQSMRSSPPPVLQSSQVYPDFGASTQVERGPFGGRLETKKKKPAKKRVGGF